MCEEWLSPIYLIDEWDHQLQWLFAGRHRNDCQKQWKRERHVHERPAKGGNEKWEERSEEINEKSRKKDVIRTEMDEKKRTEKDRLIIHVNKKLHVLLIV